MKYRIEATRNPAELYLLRSKVDDMKVLHTICFVIITAVALLGILSDTASAQMTFDGDFRVRLYNDRFSEAMDDRGDENYMRYLARVRTKMQVNNRTFIYAEFTTWTENNPTSPVRNIAGTGKMEYGVSQLFGELLFPNLLGLDLARVRVGRQQFPIGKGLSLGESYYFFDKFDGVRLDMAYRDYTLAMFGAITGQNLSESGLYPDPGSDQLYAVRLSRPVLNQNVMGYYIYQRLRGQFNDSYIFGGGVSGDFMTKRLDYLVEFDKQFYHQVDGLPEKHGFGFMGGIGYRTSLGPFRSVKVETRYAAYEGDDADTDDYEQFSPLYPNFFWGSRDGYVNGEIGGDFPYDGRNPEGSRLWFSRVYVIPTKLPRLRLQLQFIKIDEYVDNDNYNSMDDELSVKAYYKLSDQVQLQLRFCRNYPNDDDKDVNDSGQISWSEDRVKMTRFMTEINVKF